MTVKQQFEKFDICKYSFDVDLKKYSTFRIGGKASILIEPKTTDEFKKAVSFCVDSKIRYLVLGKGSNVLFDDDGYDGAIILTSGLNSVKVCGEEITAECGASLFSVCSDAEKNSLSGLEFAYGIPGSVGGGVLMNAGAYGGELCDVISSVTWFDCTSGQIGEYKGDENRFGYRTSVYSDGKKIILSATFSLKHGDKTEISEKMADIISKRKEKQPLNYPSAGSTFKRPENGYASQMIDECGLKGYFVGGAQVSEKHAGFVINRGNATSKDVLSLIEIIKKTVLEKKQTELECEVIYIPSTEDK